jgi:hypothetical protein
MPLALTQQAQIAIIFIAKNSATGDAVAQRVLGLPMRQYLAEGSTTIHP